MSFWVVGGSVSLEFEERLRLWIIDWGLFIY